jgi:hypothetical protein
LDDVCGDRDWRRSGALAAFLGVEERRGDSAMMPLTMFASRRFTGLTIVTLLLYGALGGLLLLVPYVLIKGGACIWARRLAGRCFHVLWF